MANLGFSVSATPARSHWARAGYLSMAMLTGCSSLQHKADKNDICYNQRAELLGSESYYAKSILEGVLLGAMTGAALGAITAAISGGNVGKSAGIAAGVGALGGGVAAYYQAKQRNIADADALASSIRDDILKENAEISRVSIAFAHLRDCRIASAEKIKGQYRSGILTRDQATSKLAEIKKLFDEDISIAEKYGTKMSENIKTLDYAVAEMLKGDPEAQMIFAKYQDDMAVYERDMAEYNAQKNESSAAQISTPSCGKKAKKCPAKSSKKSVSKKAEHSKITQAKAMPVKPVVSKKNPRAEAAIAMKNTVTEASQLKLKDRGDTTVSKHFTLDADTKPEGPTGWLPPEYLTPDIMVCGL